jgi:hypothetical protein
MRVLHKVALYTLSMMMFFIIIGFFCMDIPFEIGGEFIGFSQLWDGCKLGVLIIIITLIIEGIVYFFLKKSWKKNSPELSVEIVEIENQNYNTLTFIASYFVPLVSFNYLKLNHWIVLLFLLIIIGIIFCKSDGYYNNPTLALFGFRLYKTKIKTQKIDKNNSEESLIVISHKKLSIGDKTQYVMLPEGVGVVL